jgi:hypothetical protein
LSSAILLFFQGVKYFLEFAKRRVARIGLVYLKDRRQGAASEAVHRLEGKHLIGIGLVLLDIKNRGYLFQKIRGSPDVASCTCANLYDVGSLGFETEGFIE